VIPKGPRGPGFKDPSEMLKNYKELKVWPYGSVCELETQILLAGDLDLIEKGELGQLKKDIAEIERMLKALIKSLENKPLNP
jgi:four helix bundle protein